MLDQTTFTGKEEKQYATPRGEVEIIVNHCWYRH